MIKIILQIASINYDAFLEQILAQAKEHPEMLGGMKLPPFSDKIIKMIPARQKNEMMAKMANDHKSEVIPKAEALLASVLGNAQIYDMNVYCNGQGLDAIVAEIEIRYFDQDVFIDRMLPRYYHEASAQQILGDVYDGRSDLASVQQIMHAQDPKRKELMCAKSMSANKQFLIETMEQAAATKDVQLKINALRFMVK